MRFQINLDCTPEEARQFFGLPDIVPLQQTMMEELSKRLSEGIHTLEPDVLMKTWVPAIFQGWTQMQQNWWTQMQGNMAAMGPGKFTSQFYPETPAADDAPEPAPARRKR